MLIGVDFGGTGIQAGLVEGGKVLKRVSVPTEADKGKDKVIENILSAIGQVFDGKAEGIGIGCPGPADYRKGVILNSPNIPMNGVNLKETVEKRFKKPVRMDNDANCLILGEALYGAGKGSKVVIGLTLGTGVGGAIIMDGKVFQGRGNAGELGHTTICYNGIKSRCCGNDGCLENYISGANVKRRTGMLPEYFYEQAKEGNEQAIRFWKDQGTYLGVAIANFVDILDPDVVVIGGTISRAWEFFYPSLKEELEKRVLSKQDVLVRKAELEDAGIIGAAHLFKE